jgi:hypothetical protein
VIDFQSRNHLWTFRALSNHGMLSIDDVAVYPRQCQVRWNKIIYLPNVDNILDWHRWDWGSFPFANMKMKTWIARTYVHVHHAKFEFNFKTSNIKNTKIKHIKLPYWRINIDHSHRETSVRPQILPCILKTKRFSLSFFWNTWHQSKELQFFEDIQSAFHVNFGTSSFKQIISSCAWLRITNRKSLSQGALQLVNGQQKHFNQSEISCSSHVVKA